MFSEPISSVMVRLTGSVAPSMWAQRVSCFPAITSALTATAKTLTGGERNE